MWWVLLPRAWEPDGTRSAFAKKSTAGGGGTSFNIICQSIMPLTCALPCCHAAMLHCSATYHNARNASCAAPMHVWMLHLRRWASTRCKASARPDASRGRPAHRSRRLRCSGAPARMPCDCRSHPEIDLSPRQMRLAGQSLREPAFLCILCCQPCIS